MKPDSASNGGTIEATPEGGGTPLGGLTHTDRYERSEGFVKPILPQADAATCEVESCDRPRYQSKPMCGSHYMKWYRHGDPNWTRPIVSVDLTGQRFGTLTATHRIDSTHWNCTCDCGRVRRVRTWSLTSGGTRTCNVGHRRLDVVSYSAAHDRLARDRGEASKFQCVSCGRTAKHWSYRHDDPEELSAPEGPYSLNQDHYDPRCVPCHKAFDLGRDF